MSAAALDHGANWHWINTKTAIDKAQGDDKGGDQHPRREAFI